MGSIGINGTCITFLEGIYTGATARLYMDNQVSEDIPILRSVRQVDPFFNKLFTATMQEVLKMNEDSIKNGLKIHEG